MPWVNITFFLAPNDKIAAATRTMGPWRGTPSVVCRDFYPDDAVMAWQAYFDDPSGSVLFGLGRSARPRYVAPIVNDGTGVFILSERLTGALAGAAPDRLRDLAERWAEQLRLEEGEDMTEDDPLTVLEGVAQLARTSARAGDGTAVYCWHN
jgi:hypothetical protein